MGGEEKYTNKDISMKNRGVKVLIMNKYDVRSRGGGYNWKNFETKKAQINYVGWQHTAAPGGGGWKMWIRDTRSHSPLGRGEQGRWVCQLMLHFGDINWLNSLYILDNRCLLVAWGSPTIMLKECNMKISRIFLYFSWIPRFFHAFLLSYVNLIGVQLLYSLTAGFFEHSYNRDFSAKNISNSPTQHLARLGA